MKRLLLLMQCLMAMMMLLTLTTAVVEHVGEATIDADGNVVTTLTTVATTETAEDMVGNEMSIDSSIPPNEELSITITNKSPYRVDVYYDDQDYGLLMGNLVQNESTSLKSYVGHTFFVTRHGVKEGLFANPGTDQEARLTYHVGQRNQQFIVHENSGPSTNPCQDRFSICKSQAESGGCTRSPGWMIIHCCESCDVHLNSKELIDPNKRCSLENLKTPPNAWQAGDLNKLFDKWANDETLKELYDFEVVSAPDPTKYNATGGDKIKDGAPWVVVFNNFLTNTEVLDLIRGGEMEGYERSTDQGEKSELGEQAKIVSTTRTSANAWCMHKCERLAGVQSATKKIEEITGIPQVNYESFQLLQYDKNQFYRSHHDTSAYDDTPAGHRILTFFLYLSDVEEGGETYFNQLDLAIKPKKGRALVWPSVMDDNPEYWDRRMYHEAKDVIKGKKLAANHWIHLNDYHTPNHWGCTGSFA